MIQPEWIAVDWGTSNLRVWAMGTGDTVLASAQSDKGMGSLAPDEFEPALLELTGTWLGKDRRTPVIACGMVGARQGWQEADYRCVPTAPVTQDVTNAPALDPRHDVRIIAGLCQHDPADVMRGEETQIAGFLLGEPAFDGTLCLPGTHTKWVRVRDGRIESFRTVMTGELFALLATKSTLRLTVAATGWDDDAFASAVRQAVDAPEKITGELFGLRSGALVNDLPGEVVRAHLSGLLIGAELSGTRAFWSNLPVRIIGGTSLAQSYQAALALVGNTAEPLDGEKLTLAGLTAAHHAQLEVSR